MLKWLTQEAFDGRHDIELKRDDDCNQYRSVSVFKALCIDPVYIFFRCACVRPTLSWECWTCHTPVTAKIRCSGWFTCASWMVQMQYSHAIPRLPLTSYGHRFRQHNIENHFPLDIGQTWIWPCNPICKSTPPSLLASCSHPFHMIKMDDMLTQIPFPEIQGNPHATNEWYGRFHDDDWESWNAYPEALKATGHKAPWHRHHRVWPCILHPWVRWKWIDAYSKYSMHRLYFVLRITGFQNRSIPWNLMEEMQVRRETSWDMKLNWGSRKLEGTCTFWHPGTFGLRQCVLYVFVCNLEDNVITYHKPQSLNLSTWIDLQQLMIRSSHNRCFM